MQTKSSGIVMDVAVGETVRIRDGEILVIVEQKSGQKARLRFIADRSVKIERPNRIATAVA
jgi:pyruvate kinase